ncbi:unnamed protein product [Cylindrotheca closterium]|uniref:Protein kinase domain-containing protein n=1 Tax=Cylindrotheca closterium TaxID=2856 RepID=A0AAD2FMP7_9STRA|nr:unnamed protein product [Cylindrotheca closterium]
MTHRALKSGAESTESSESQKEAESQIMYERVETVALGIAQALSYMHQRAIVHRDLKPANAGFKKTAGEVCIFDFGFARDPTSCNLSHFSNRSDQRQYPSKLGMHVAP